MAIESVSNLPQKEVIPQKQGPAPSGPYSPAVKFGELIFVSGIASKNRDASIEDQVRQVLENIRLRLEDSGSSMDRVLKMTVIMQDIGEWSRMNSVFKEFFPKNPPARTTFQSNIASKVEIDAIAC